VQRDKQVDGKSLEKIVQRTLEAIRTALTQLISISETTYLECEKIQNDLKKVRTEIKGVTEEVDNLYVAYRDARLKLLEIKQRPDGECSKSEIEAAYETAHKLQIRLVVMREREKALRKERDELERSYANLASTKKRADELLSQVGVVMEYLESDLKDVNTSLLDMKQRKLIGLELVRAREAERKRIAREIHDGPAQVFANIAFGLELCEKLLDTDRERLVDELRRLRELARMNLGELRKIIYHLKPAVIDEYGLVRALERYVEQFEETYAIDTELVILNEEQKLDSMIELSVFRIVQEALVNVAKHSAAKTCRIKLEFMPSVLNLVVSDDGIGFEVERALEGKTDSFGLLNIRERVELLDGEVSIQSKLGRGTKVVVKIPTAVKGKI
jgi:two-component system sensor histidine kinase DegS